MVNKFFTKKETTDSPAPPHKTAYMEIIQNYVSKFEQSFGLLPQNNTMRVQRKVLENWISTSDFQSIMGHRADLNVDTRYPGMILRIFENCLSKYIKFSSLIRKDNIHRYKNINDNPQRVIVY